jgi:hypothetical protein
MRRTVYPVRRTGGRASAAVSDEIALTVLTEKAGTKVPAF